MSDLPATSKHAIGGCLCGGVRFELRGVLRPVIYCHCKQCRRTSGHYVAATACSTKNLSLLSEETLSWYDSSASARRAFCKRCGSSLFWQARDEDYIAIMAGAVDAPSGLTEKLHIYVANAGDYYKIADGLPQCQQDSSGW